MPLLYHPTMNMTTTRCILMAGLGLAVLLGAPMGHAQDARRISRVAVLHLTAPTPPFDTFRKTMRELGWREGQTLVIDYRGADGRAERLEQLAAEIVTARPDVIVTGT